MKFIKFLIIIFISIIASIKANSNDELIHSLKEGKRIIFIRHAYAPGSGDPNNFDIKDCSSQRNIDDEGRNQSKNIGFFFSKNDIPIDKVISSEWCRCIDTAKIAFNNNYEVNSFLNSFYNKKFSKNKESQIKKLKEYINNWNSNKNLILVTHYVVIFELLGTYPSSGEIVISDKNYNVIGSLKIKY